MAYAHGTGHGVGAYLGVHEGPHGISFRYSILKLKISKSEFCDFWHFFQAVSNAPRKLTGSFRYAEAVSARTASSMGVFKGSNQRCWLCRLRPNEVALEAGMLSSIEPGYYVRFRTESLFPNPWQYFTRSSIPIQSARVSVSLSLTSVVRPQQVPPAIWTPNLALNRTLCVRGQVAGSYGIRIENIVRVLPMPGSQNMLKFEPLTLIPFQVIAANAPAI